MAIRVRGTIVITRKSGKRGAFNIGELRSEIGNFEVKDALIEEYEEGKYTGDFLIRWIEPDSVAWHGRVFVKVRAQLDAMVIDDADTSPVDAPTPPPELDPVEQVQQAGAPAIEMVDDACATKSTARKSTATRAASSSPADSLDPLQASDDALFGVELFALLQQRHPIKLDPTVDRPAFRAQRDRLKDCGYSFDPKAQTWSISAP